MALVFNPFTSNFDEVVDIAANAVGSTPSATGVTITQSGTNVALTLQPADGTHPGLMTSVNQTFSGIKNFSSNIFAANLSGTNSGDVTLGTMNGLGLSGQVLSLSLATISTPGAVLNIGGVNGVATLDGAGHIPLSQLPPTLIEYQGTWDASTNTPTLSNSSGTFNVSGYFFIVSTGGTVNFGAGAITFNAGDWVLYNGSIWERAVQSNVVQSVNGQTGVVTVNAINQLTGDGTAGPASGSSSAALTLATVNGNVGSFAIASITVNAKGLVTAASAATTTGAGSTVVLANTPTLITPILGVPISVNLANATNLNLLTGVSNTLPEGNGGTGTGTYTTGDMLYASAANTLSKVSIGSTGQVLTVAGGIPTWAAGAGSSISLSPTVQRFTSGSGTYGLSYYFSVTSASATAGATYTNNGQTYTVTNTISSGTLLLATSTGAPLTSGTLTKATGTGDSTITFSAFYAPTSLDVTIIAGGGGSGGGGVSAGGGGGTGGNTTFGTSLLTANGGGGGGASTSGGAGGTVSIFSPASTIIGITGGGGQGGGVWTTTQSPVGGAGGTNIMGGSGRSGGGVGGPGNTNTGAGASGADGGVGTTNTGGGGGAGGALRALINSPSATYAYGVGGGGSAGTAGGAGNAGYVGGSGVIIVVESFATGGSAAGLSPNINVITKTANYSAAASDGLILCNSSTSTMTVTLPTAVGVTGAILRIKKIDATFNSIVTMATTSSQTIDGASTTTLNSLNEEISVCSDGANWQLLSRTYPQTPVTYTPTYTGFGTVSSPNLFYKRSGSNMIISGTGTCGTVTSSTLSITLPSGALTPTLNANNTVVGTMVVTQFVAASYTTLVGSATNTITFGIQSATQTGQGSYGGTSVFSGNNLPFSFIATVPIAGWN